MTMRVLMFGFAPFGSVGPPPRREQRTFPAVHTAVTFPRSRLAALYHSSGSCTASDAGDPIYLMRSFWKWLEHVGDDPSAADTVATLIAQAGAVGISVQCLRKIVRLSPESLDEVLKGLLASRQVVLLKVNGARVYRAA